jgi:hypothetical protein
VHVYVSGIFGVYSLYFSHGQTRQSKNRIMTVHHNLKQLACEQFHTYVRGIPMSRKLQQLQLKYTPT